ncbi:MAG: SagB/ThcOx family dehydrogenase [Brachymonas sp.]|nr:SagB/ThcOx family dehydrogenase [Brachymonas sp.]
MKNYFCFLVSLAACLHAQAGSPAAGHPLQDGAAGGGSAQRQDAGLYAARATPPAMAQSQHMFTLPPPALNGAHSLAQLLKQRRSVRNFAPAPLTLAHIGQLLWAAQGITADGKLRTAPSAGALYPLELYVVAGHVEGLPSGVYHYQPHGHCLVPVVSGDKRHELASAAVKQMWIATAPAVVVFGAVHARTAAKYGSRASRYVHIEVGHAAENLFLQAQDLDLATADIGAFDDQEVARVLRLPGDVAPLLLMPVGVPR